jgi:hypothetical protein
METSFQTLVSQADARYSGVGVPLELARKHAEFIHVDGHGIDHRAVNAALRYHMFCQNKMLFDDLVEEAYPRKARMRHHVRPVLESLLAA